MAEEIIVIYTMDSINLTFRCVCIENLDAEIMLSQKVQKSNV